MNNIFFNCVICKKKIEDEWGNNPYPVWGNIPYPVGHEREGQCCNECNDSVVIPARLKQLGVG